MINNRAKFHKDSPSGKKVKFNLARAIELSEMAVFVYRNLMQVSNFGGTFDQLFKNDQKLKSRGSCLKCLE